MKTDKVNVKKRLLYLHLEIGNISSGVAKKVLDQIQGLEARYSCEYLRVEEKSVLSLIRTVYRKVLQTDCAVLYIRNKLFLNLFFLPLLVLKKRRKTVLVLEIPTPLEALEQEIRISGHSTFKRVLSVWLLRIAMPLTLPLFDLVVTVLNETGRYGKYIKREAVIGNGINPRRISFSPKVQNEREALHFLAIGSIARWHGYDRLIDGLHEYAEIGGMENMPVFLEIVGYGPACESLQKSITEYGIEQYVHFHGEVNDPLLLEEIYARTDLGVGSLGAHRRALTQTASLKHREFCAYGLSFITSAFDPDFPPDEVDFVFYQRPDDSPIDVAGIVKQLMTLRRRDTHYRERIRKYAETHLDWSVKFEPLFREIEKASEAEQDEKKTV